MDAKDLQRFTATRAVVTMLLRSADFRRHLRHDDQPGTQLPVVVVLAEDPLSYMIARVEEQDLQRAVVVVVDGDRAMTVEVSRAPIADAVDLPLNRATSPVAMLASYLREWKGRPVTLSIVQDGLTTELLDEVPIPA